MQWCPAYAMHACQTGLPQPCYGCNAGDRLLQGDVRLADANPGIGRAPPAAEGRVRSFSEPADGAPATTPSGSYSGGGAHTQTRTASTGSELPVSMDSEVMPAHHRIAEVLY